MADDIRKKFALGEDTGLSQWFNPALNYVVEFAELSLAFPIGWLALSMGAINVVVFLAWKSPKIRLGSTLR